jgi:hypothetical protein
LYHKIEIPISLAPQSVEPAFGLPFCAKSLDPMAGNSNCQLEFSHANGQCCVIASLQGPTESKFGSKQDYQKAFIEVNLRMSASKDFRVAEDDPLAVTKTEIAANLKTCLEAII